MRRILLASHGQLASGMKNTVELFIGKDNTIQTIDAYVNEGAEDYPEKIQKFLNQISKTDEGIIFTDIIGGSVNQKVVQMCFNSKNDVFIISGMNLPSILSIILHSGKLSNSEINEILTQTNVSLVDMHSMKSGGKDNEDDDDFL